MSNKNKIRNKIKEKKTAVSTFFEENELGDLTEEQEDTNIESKEENVEVNVQQVEDEEIEENETHSEQEKPSGEGHSALKETMNDLTNFDDEPEKVFRGFYFDKDVIDVLNRIAEKKKNKKGFKSEFINGIVRSVFEDYGFLKKK